MAANKKVLIPQAHFYEWPYLSQEKASAQSTTDTKKRKRHQAILPLADFEVICSQPFVTFLPMAMSYIECHHRLFQAQ